MRRLVINLIMVCVLIMGMTVPVMAYTLPSTSAICSVTITMQDNGKVVSGGSLTLYKTGEVHPTARTYTFLPTEEFKNSGIPVHDYQNEQVAERLANYAVTNNISGVVKEIGEDGLVEYGELQPGLYMIAQTETAAGYVKIAPFQLAVPEFDGKEYEYNIGAMPKVVSVEYETGEESTEEEQDQFGEDGIKEEPPTDDELMGETELVDEEKGKLPQTGQLKWPVPVLAIIGLLMFAAGWYMHNVQRKGGYEK